MSSSPREAFRDSLTSSPPQGLITLVAPEEALALTREGDILRIERVPIGIQSLNVCVHFVHEPPDSKTLCRGV